MDCRLWTMDYGLWTTDYGLRTTEYGLGIKHGLGYKTRTVRYGLGIKHEERFYKLNKFSHERFCQRVTLAGREGDEATAL